VTEYHVHGASGGPIRGRAVVADGANQNIVEAIVIKIASGVDAAVAANIIGTCAMYLEPGRPGHESGDADSFKGTCRGGVPEDHINCSGRVARKWVSSVGTDHYIICSVTIHVAGSANTRAQHIILCPSVDPKSIAVSGCETGQVKPVASVATKDHHCATGITNATSIVLR
jgi:hypothetical protein